MTNLSTHVAVQLDDTGFGFLKSQVSSLCNFRTRALD